VEEFLMCFIILTIITFISVSLFFSYKPAVKLDSLSLHLAICELTQSPINELSIRLHIPPNVVVIFDKNTITIVNAIVDPRVRSFNYTGILKQVTAHMIVYKEDKVWFKRKVIIQKSITLKLVYRFGAVEVIPVGG